MEGGTEVWKGWGGFSGGWGGGLHRDEDEKKRERSTICFLGTGRCKKKKK